jgi:glycosyltransferase involved in cell wall biosynthesis
MKLERIYHDPDYLDSLAALALANARRPEYRWETIAKKWDKVFSGVLNS